MAASKEEIDAVFSKYDPKPIARATPEEIDAVFAKYNPVKAEEPGFLDTVGTSVQRGVARLGFTGSHIPEALALEKSRQASAGFSDLIPTNFTELVASTSPASVAGNVLPKFLKQLALSMGNNREEAISSGNEAAASLAAGNVDLQKKLATLPGKDVTQRVNESETFGAGFKEFASDPIGVLADIGPESLVQIAPALAGGFASKSPTVGAALLGGSSFTTETISGLTDYLGRNGVDITDADAVTKALQDPETLSKAMDFATTRGGIIGSVDAATGGLASLNPLTKVVKNKAVSEALNALVAQPIAQGAAGGAGEAAASLATTGEVEPGAVLLEAFGELVGTPAEVIAQGRKRFSKGSEPAPIVPPVPPGPNAPPVAGPNELDAAIEQAKAAIAGTEPEVVAPEPAPAPVTPAEAEQVAQVVVEGVPGAKPEAVEQAVAAALPEADPEVVAQAVDSVINPEKPAETKAEPAPELTTTMKPADLPQEFNQAGLSGFRELVEFVSSTLYGNNVESMKFDIDENGNKIIYVKASEFNGKGPDYSQKIVIKPGDTSIGLGDNITHAEFDAAKGVDIRLSRKDGKAKNVVSNIFSPITEAPKPEPAPEAPLPERVTETIPDSAYDEVAPATPEAAKVEPEKLHQAFELDNKLQAVKMSDGSFLVRTRPLTSIPWSAVQWESRKELNTAGMNPMQKPSGVIKIPGLPPFKINEKYEQEKISRGPKDLIFDLATGPKLNLDAFVSQLGLDPADVAGRRAGYGRLDGLMTKEGGLTPDGLVEWMSESGEYLVEGKDELTPDAAYAKLQQALGGDRVVAASLQAEEDAFQNAEYEANREAQLESEGTVEENQDAWLEGFEDDPGLSDSEFDTLVNDRWEKTNVIEGTVPQDGAQGSSVPEAAVSEPAAAKPEPSEPEPARAPEQAEPESSTVEQPAPKTTEKPATTEPEERTTSTKNAKVEEERADRGAAEILREATISNPETIAAAQQAMKEDPDLAADIVHRLNNTLSEEISVLDEAVMLVHKVQIMNERARAGDRVGNENLTEDQRALAREKWAALETQLEEIDQATRRSGAIWGRFGQFRSRLIREDFSFAAMERRAKATRGAKGEWTVEDSNKIREQADKIAAMTKRQEEMAQEIQDIKDRAQAEVLMDLIGQKFEGRNAPKKTTKNFVKKLNQQADESRKWLRGNFGQTNEGITTSVQAMFHIVRIGASHIVNGAVKFVDWVSAMKADLGNETWSQIEDEADSIFAEAKGLSESEAIETGQRIAADIIAKAQAESMAGQQLSHRTVYDLARAHILQNVPRDEVMAAVHRDLEPFFENLTEEDVRYAFSQYGQTILPSKLADKIVLAELRNLVRIQLSIDRLYAGLPAKKTGLQRAKATKDIRDLEAVLNALMKERELRNPEVSPENLAGVNERRLTALKNRIADLEEELRSGKKKPASKVVPDTPEVAAKRKERDEVQAKLDAIERAKNPPKTEQERKIDARIKDLDKQIAALEAELKTGQKAPGKKPGVVTAEITALIARRDKLRKTLDAVEKAKKPVKTKEEIVNEARITRLEKQIKELNEEIATGQKKAKAAVTPQTAEVEAITKLRDALKDKLREIEEAKNPPETTDEKYNRVRGNQLRRDLAEVRARRKAGDYARRPRPVQPELTKANQQIAVDLAKEKMAFLQERMAEEIANGKPGAKIGNVILHIISLQRSIMTSYDDSGVLRQGGAAAFAHPILAAKAVRKSFKAITKRGAHAIEEDIKADKNYALSLKAKLEIMALMDVRQEKMEELFRSKYQRYFPGVPLSGRLFVTFLNVLRMELFNQGVEYYGHRGVLSLERAKDIANGINVMTGRGVIGTRKNNLNGKLLTLLAFAPKWTASRFNLLFGQPFYSGDKITRIYFAKEYARMIGGWLFFHTLLALAFSDEDDEPTSWNLTNSNFGKVRVGNTRLDATAGMSTAMVFMARMISGWKQQQNGLYVPIRNNLRLDLEGTDPNAVVPYRGDTGASVAGDFARTKAAPPISFLVNTISGEDPVGNPITPLESALNMVTPLSVNDFREAMQEHGFSKTAALQAAATFGVSMQTYGDHVSQNSGKKTRPRRKPRPRVERPRRKR